MQIIWMVYGYQYSVYYQILCVLAFVVHENMLEEEIGDGRNREFGEAVVHVVLVEFIARGRSKVAGYLPFLPKEK